MRRQNNEVSALRRRADRLQVMSETLGILSFIPTMASVLWAFGDLLTGAVWFSAGAVLMVCAWILHREADKLSTAAYMRGKVIPPEVIRICMMQREAKRK